MSKLGTKQIVAAVLAVIAILGAATAIFFQTRSAGVNVKLHQAFGEALAEQVATITNAGKIALITLDSKKFPVLKAQQDGFEKGLRKYSNLKLDHTVEVNAEGKAKYGPGRGLALDRYLRIAKKYSGRDDIIVS